MAGVLVKIRGVNCEGKDWIMPSDVNFRLVLVRTLFKRYIVHCSYIVTVHVYRSRQCTVVYQC